MLLKGGDDLLKIKIIEREVDTVWGEKEIERTTLVLVEGKADTYCLKIVEYSKDGKKWHNRSIGYSLGDKKFNETDGNVILLESIDAEK